jgi:hypothetical protein
VTLRDASAGIAFVVGWASTVLCGITAPFHFVGMVALPLALLGVLGIVAFGVLLHPRPGGNFVVGLLLISLGGLLFVGGGLGIGVEFMGPGPQPPDILRFPSLGEAMAHAFGDPAVTAVGLAGAAALAIGGRLRLRSGSIGAALLFVVCCAAFPAIVIGLHGS